MEEKVVQMGRIGPRPFWVLQLSILVRAIHQIGGAVFLTFYLLGNPREIPQFFLLLAVISGGVLQITEWMRHREFYRELSGVVTFVKLILLGLAYHVMLPQAFAATVVLIAYFIASIAAHSPRIYRHRLLY